MMIEVVSNVKPKRPAKKSMIITNEIQSLDVKRRTGWFILRKYVGRDLQRSAFAALK
jgi:hypothetical protein